MTCSDCEVNKNIYSFGTCECGNMYSEKLPHPGPRRYESYKESIVDHSDILLDERYAEAWEYKDNPFIYVSIIGPIYATGSDYGDTAASIMHDYFMWDDEENDESAVSDGNAITAEKFYKAIRGYGQKIENTSSMILLSFDAATPGRLSMVEEATLESAKYLENIKKWHESCGWIHKKWKDKKRG